MGNEYTLRNPEEWRTEKVLKMCNGLKVVLDHPEDTPIASPEFIEERQVGEIIHPYFKGDEIWGIAVITNKDVAKVLTDTEMSTSPGVLTGRATKEDIHGDDVLTVESAPLHLDHIAICKNGVWDKQGDPQGIDSPANRLRELRKNNDSSKIKPRSTETNLEETLNSPDLEKALNKIEAEPEDDVLSKAPSKNDATVDPSTVHISEEKLQAARDQARQMFENNHTTDKVAEAIYKDVGIPNDQAQTIALEVKEKMADPSKKDGTADAREVARKAFERGDKAETVKEEIRKMCPELKAEEIDRITAEEDDKVSGTKKDADPQRIAAASASMQAMLGNGISLEKARECLHQNCGFTKEEADAASQDASASKADAERKEMQEKLKKMDADLAKEREEKAALCAKMDSLEKQLPAKLDEDGQNELAETVSQMDSALAAAGLPPMQTLWSDTAESVRQRFVNINKKFSPFYKDEDVASYTPKQQKRAITEIIQDMAKGAMAQARTQKTKLPPIVKSDGSVIRRESLIDVLEETGF